MSLSEAKRTRRASLMEETSNPLGINPQKCDVNHLWVAFFIFVCPGIRLDLCAERAEVRKIRRERIFMQSRSDKPEG